MILQAPHGGSPGEAYWAAEPQTIAARLMSGPGGLSQEEAAARLATFGANRIVASRTRSPAALILDQLKSPLLLILLFAAVAAALGGEWIDAIIVFVIASATVGITYSRERRAHVAIAALQSRVQTRTTTLRDGRPRPVLASELVPGDVVLLAAGSLVPGDGVVVEATDFFVSEAVLTGESFPAEKRAGLVPAGTPLRDRSNCVFLGSNVRSGTARCLIVATGLSTEFGAVARRLATRPPETEFDRGLRHFGYLLTSAMLVLVLLVFAVHVKLGRPPIETLLFSVALAVGLSPELLPAILSVNLARGAQLMAKHGVIVRRLNAIENLGSMNVLCTDKTGTLTEGTIVLEGSYAADGQPSSSVLELAACNAGLETGLDNPLDAAILRACPPHLAGIEKMAEIPFDFTRKAVSIVVSDADGRRLITKGAFDHVIGFCTELEGGQRLDEATLGDLRRRYEGWTRQGIRVIAVARREVRVQPRYSRDDERELTFAGFLTFFDRPKSSAPEAIASLAKLGVAVKVITGDSRLVAEHLAPLIGLAADRVVTGGELLGMSDEALWRVAERTDLFVEVDPNQKERIIRALRKMGHVVGFLGDGVNDAPAMHAADTSLSVEQAVDVAREAADFILLEPDLQVIRRGIEEGRRTFANTLKYVLITTSANLGNMVSMAAASLFLPFLPLLSGQILLNNFLSDIPAVGLADDAVDEEMVERPERWDMRFISRFMIEFGLVSSLFDFCLFAVLLGVFSATPELFRTAWFVESLLTELVIALVVRTRRPFFRSRPGRLLLWSTICVAVVAFVIPYLPYVSLIGFVPLPAPLVASLCVIVVLYVAATEGAKRWFFGASAK